MYNFYSQNNIKYSDVSGKILKILPVLLIIEDKIFIYDNNFFMKIGIKIKNKKQ